MSLRMLQGRCQAVLEAKGVDALKSELVGFAHSLGFDKTSMIAVFDQSLTRSEFHSIDNAPLEYRESFSDERLGKIDPVMQHCKKTSSPIIWDQNTYVAQGKGELWENQAQFGYKNGVGLALHFPGGYHFCIGIDDDKLLPLRKNSLSKIIGKLQLFALHAQEAAFRILLETPEVKANVSLTPRELETLRWTLDGKLAWEVGEALNISERTAVFHLQNAMRKLGCNNKHQAVLKALRLGMFY